MQQQGSIPTPPDFPVNWQDPDDERLFWTRDAMHFPNPVNALEDEFFVRIAQGDGFARASEAYDMPVKNLVRLVNTYLYSAMAPAVAPEEMEAAGERSQQKIGEAMARLGERWHDEYLLEIRQHLEYWDRFDLRGAPIPELLAHLDETVDRFRRVFEIHFTISFPMMISVSVFEEL